MRNASDAVGRVIDRVEQLPFEVDAILADRGYYQSASFDVLGPRLRWFSRSSKGKTASPSTLDTRLIMDRLYALYKGKDRELQLSTRSVIYHNGDRGENGEVVRRVVACDRPIARPGNEKPSIANAQPLKPAIGSRVEALV